MEALESRMMSHGSKPQKTAGKLDDRRCLAMGPWYSQQQESHDFFSNLNLGVYLHHDELGYIIRFRFFLEPNLQSYPSRPEKYPGEDSSTRSMFSTQTTGMFQESMNIWGVSSSSWGHPFIAACLKSWKIPLEN